MSPIDMIHARTAELQSLIDTVSPGAAPAGRMGADQSAAVQSQETDFAAALADQLAPATGAASTTTAPGPASLTSSDGQTVAGLSLDEFAAAEVTPGSGLDLLQRAMGYLGVPYVWGGATPDGFDCSGLVQYVFKQMGVDVPRVVRQQMTAGTEIPSLDQAQPGDLIVTRNGGHIGIYVGGDQMLHSPQPGDSVKIGKIYGDILTIRRIVPTGEVSPAVGSPAAMTTPAAMTAADVLAAGGLDRSALLAMSGGFNSATSPAALSSALMSGGGGLDQLSAAFGGGTSLAGLLSSMGVSS